MAALVDGRLRDLTTPLTEDAAVTPVTPLDADGARIYRRSLSFLLMTATAEVFRPNGRSRARASTAPTSPMATAGAP